MIIATQTAERRVDDTTRRFFSPGARFQRPGLTSIRALAAFMLVIFHAHHFVILAPRLTAGPIDVTPLVTIGWAEEPFLRRKRAEPLGPPLSPGRTLRDAISGRALP